MIIGVVVMAAPGRRFGDGKKDVESNARMQPASIHVRQVCLPRLAPEPSL